MIKSTEIEYWLNGAVFIEKGNAFLDLHNGKEERRRRSHKILQWSGLPCTHFVGK